MCYVLGALALFLILFGLLMMVIVGVNQHDRYSPDEDGGELIPAEPPEPDPVPVSQKENEVFV
jgi:hypothetical protein